MIHVIHPVNTCLIFLLNIYLIGLFKKKVFVKYLRALTRGQAKNVEWITKNYMIDLGIDTCPLYCDHAMPGVRQWVNCKLNGELAVVNVTVDTSTDLISIK